MEPLPRGAGPILATVVALVLVLVAVIVGDAYTGHSAATPVASLVSPIVAALLLKLNLNKTTDEVREVKRAAVERTAQLHERLDDVDATTKVIARQTNGELTGRIEDGVETVLKRHGLIPEQPKRRAADPKPKPLKATATKTARRRAEK